MWLRDLGEEFAWSDLRDIIDYLPASSAYVRSTHPDGPAFATPEMQMLGELATIASAIRFLLAIRSLDDVPEDWAPVRFGPARGEDEPAEADSESVDRARGVAASMRG